MQREAVLQGNACHVELVQLTRETCLPYTTVYKSLPCVLSMAAELRL